MIAGSGDAHGGSCRRSVGVVFAGVSRQDNTLSLLLYRWPSQLYEDFRGMSMLPSLEKAYDCTCLRPPSGPHGSVSRRL